MRLLYSLLPYMPVGLASNCLGGPALLTFAAAAVDVIPPAAIAGEATESIATRTGPRVGGFLNATLGSAAERTITFFAIRAGRLDLAHRLLPIGITLPRHPEHAIIRLQIGGIL